MEADRANIIAAAASPFNSAVGSEGDVSVASRSIEIFLHPAFLLRGGGGPDFRRYNRVGP